MLAIRTNPAPARMPERQAARKKNSAKRRDTCSHGIVLDSVGPDHTVSDHRPVETPPAANPVDESGSPFSPRVFKALLQLARQYKRQFVIIAVFAFLATGAD